MKHKVYSKEFRLDALSLVKTKGFVATAKELGISETALRNWAKQYNFSKQTSDAEMRKIAALLEKNRALEKEQKKLKATIKILEDATAFFRSQERK